jgi:hypothetical protein
VLPHVVRDIVGHPDIEVTITIYAIDEKLKKLGKHSAEVVVVSVVIRTPGP